MMKNIRNQSGQAMMELTVMLLAISAMIIAMIILSGVQLSSNSFLLDARFEAMKNARSETASNISGNEYRSWNYATLDLSDSRIQSGFNPSGESETTLFESRKKYKFHGNRALLKSNLKIPFSIRSTSISTGNNTTAPAYGGAREQQYSEGALYKSEGWRHGFFQGRDNVDFTETISSQNALDAANLIKGRSSDGNNVATMNSSHQSGNLNSSQTAATSMYNTFFHLFGIRINRISLAGDETNLVYFPPVK